MLPDAREGENMHDDKCADDTRSCVNADVGNNGKHNTDY